MFDRIKFLPLFLAYFCLLAVVAADCDSDSYSYEDEFCVDSEQCCGGCCVNGVCIDSSRLCMYSQDVCEGHSCLGEETCVAYSPPECGGCEPVPVCTLLR